MTQDSASDLVVEMQAYYDRRASWYDSSMRYDDADVVRSLEPIFEDLRSEMRDRTALEIACGPGFWTQRVAESASSILATDYNESTLAEARRKRIDASRVTFVRADAYELAQVGRGFTGAFAVDWLAHVPASRLRPFLEGLHARLSPDARVAFCDQTPGPSSITGIRDAEGNHLQERTLRDGSRYRVIKHFLSDTEYRELLSPFTDHVTIRRYPDQRRVLVSYSIVSPERA
jgi:2-polyprenyl-3-methyl-5-hydroxy-6-metoxy-1,4-benzoquinol methylase